MHVAAENGFYAIVSDILKIYKNKNIDCNIQDEVGIFFFLNLFYFFDFQEILLIFFLFKI